MKYDNLLIGNLRGKMGGLVGATNRGGNYLRSKGITTNPNTPNQIAIRTFFGASSLFWRLITDAQRDAWTAYAVATPVLKNGIAITLTGQQMFVRCNSFRTYNGEVVRADGPTTAGLPAFTPVSIVASMATGVTVTVDPTDGWATGDFGGLFGSLSDGQSASINFFKAPFRKGGGIYGAMVGPIPATFVMPITGGWAIGKKVFVRVNVTDDEGRIGQAQNISTIIVA